MSRRRHADLIGHSGEPDPAPPPAPFSTGSEASKAHEIMSGVSVEFLVRVFGTTRHKVEKKLRNCPSIGKGRNGAPLFDLAEAASYLVTPRVDLESYIAGLKPDQLPERWRESYWNAALKRQKWESNARQLWHTADVLDALSGLFKTVRTSLQLIPDRLEKAMGLTPEQRKIVVALIDEIQDDLHKQLSEAGSTRQTYSQVALESDPIEDEE